MGYTLRWPVFAVGNELYQPRLVVQFTAFVEMPK